MAAVEDEMWFYRALHAHLERKLIQALRGKAATQPLVLKSEQANESDPGNSGTRMMGTRPRILDAGCGTGGLIRRLENVHADWQWTGVDVEPLACEFARTRCAAKILEGSLLSLPFPEGTFDAVVCSDVLYHLDDDAAALKEILRVLRPGGVVVANVPAHRWLWSYHDVTVHGRRRYERTGLAQRLRSVGFDDPQLTHWNLLPLPLVFIRRKLLPAPRSGSDVRLYPRAIEAIFRVGTAVERWWLNSIGALPMGSSILATARKPWRRASRLPF